MTARESPHIADILNSKETIISYEFFPPKTEPKLSELYTTIAELCANYKPQFCSITWGAGGSTVTNSFDAVNHIQTALGQTCIAHFTGLGMSPDIVNDYIEKFTSAGIRNILALRGDKPHTSERMAQLPANGFKFASELVQHIRSSPKGGGDHLGLLVAGCPEGHPESKSLAIDMDHLAVKVKLGADGIITQFFFDNNSYDIFTNHLNSRNVHVPISVGIMPITKAKMVKRMVEMSGCSIPEPVQSAIVRYDSDNLSMEAWGIDYAIRQVEDLFKRGAKNFHFYTLNQFGPTSKIINALSFIHEQKVGAIDCIHIPYREYCAFPDGELHELLKVHGIDANQPHDIVFNQAMQRYEISQKRSLRGLN
ncbi:MAG: methylenetetrahydrofolate reductase (NADPH) [Candidatus Omnitrophota bacterium]|jgi:methylenetetrahydrofolate reductase (NADPH)